MSSGLPKYIAECLFDLFHGYCIEFACFPSQFSACWGDGNDVVCYLVKAVYVNLESDF